jgi:hypothetical protein
MKVIWGVSQQKARLMKSKPGHAQPQSATQLVTVQDALEQAQGIHVILTAYKKSVSGHKGGVLGELAPNLNSKVPGMFPSWIMVQIAI